MANEQEVRPERGVIPTLLFCILLCNGGVRVPTDGPFFRGLWREPRGDRSSALCSPAPFSNARQRYGYCAFGRVSVCRYQPYVSRGVSW